MAMDIEKAAKAFRKIRDARKALKDAWEVQDKEMAEKLDMISVAFLEHLRTHKLKSMRTAVGTIALRTSIKPAGSDWDAIYKWIAENDGWDMLERRIKSTFIATYMEANGDALPPGVSVYTVQEARLTAN